MDLVKMLYLVRRNTLYLLVQTQAPPQAAAEVFFDVLMDFDMDDQIDAEFSFFLSSPASNWHYRHSPPDFVPLPDLETAMGSFFEVAIPLESFDFAQFQILPLLRDNGIGINYDEWDRWVPIALPPPTAVQEEQLSILPQSLALEQNLPNPFNSSTAIRFSLPRPERVRLRIYNLEGQEIRRLVDGFQAAGVYQVSWDGRIGQGRQAGSGLYFYRLEAGKLSRVRRMILLK